jgi:hypothetical protein
VRFAATVSSEVSPPTALTRAIVDRIELDDLAALGEQPVHDRTADPAGLPRSRRTSAPSRQR